MQGEELLPLDLCEPDTTMHNLLTQHGAIPSADLAQKQPMEPDQSAESGLQRDEATGELSVELADLSLAEDETLSIPSVRPTTPSRRSFVGDPVFESDKPEYADTSQHPSRIPTPVTPPPAPEEVVRQGPGILKKMFSVMRKKSSEMPQDSILSSVVGFYAAQMTLLAAAIIGKECVKGRE